MMLIGEYVGFNAGKSTISIGQYIFNQYHTASAQMDSYGTHPASNVIANAFKANSGM